MKGFRKFLARPFASILLLGLILYSLWRVPTADTTDCSVTGWTLPALRANAPERIHAISVFLIKDQNSFRVEDLDKSSSQGLLDALHKDADDVFRAQLVYQRIAGGLYDITSFTDLYELELRPMGTRVLTPAETASATAAFAGWLSSKEGANRPNAAEAIRGITPRPWKPHWPGIVHTALAAIVWVLFLASLAWIPDWLRAIRRRRRRDSLMAGRCPSCGYEIYGLQHDICPECGKLLQA